MNFSEGHNYFPLTINKLYNKKIENKRKKQVKNIINNKNIMYYIKKNLTIF